MAFAAFGDYFGWITSAAQLNQRAAPEMPPSTVFSLIPLLLLYMIVVCLVSAAYEASCLRWLVRGETSGFLGLAFGADMWRVWFCYWMWLALLLGVYLA